MKPVHVDCEQTHHLTVTWMGDGYYSLMISNYVPGGGYVSIAEYGYTEAGLRTVLAWLGEIVDRPECTIEAITDQRLRDEAHTVARDQPEITLSIGCARILHNKIRERLEGVASGRERPQQNLRTWEKRN